MPTSRRPVQSWVATYFVATRYGTTAERTRQYPGNLPKDIVQRSFDSFIERRRSVGEAILPQTDLQLENVA